MNAFRLASAAVLLLLACSTAPAAAEFVLNDHEVFDFDEPQAWAMAWTAAVTYPSELGSAEPLAPGALEVSLEGGWVPTLSEDQRRVGFRGTKPEDLNRTSVFGRPRLSVGLPAAFWLTVGWTPPVDLGGVEPNLVSASLGRRLWRGQHGAIAARLVGEVGKLTGDFTCPADLAGTSDPNVNPYSCEAPSKDELSLRLFGVELSASATPERWPRVSPYVALGASRLHAEFQVDSHRSGFHDRTLLETDGTIWNASAGVSFAASARTRVAGELFYAPLTVEGRAGHGSEHDGLFNARVLLAWRAR